MLRFLADQVRGSRQDALRRFDRKPKCLASRELFLVQALPGVGPGLAHRLLDHFGSVQRIFTADADDLTEVRAVGPTEAGRIGRWFASESQSQARRNDCLGPRTTRV